MRVIILMLAFLILLSACAQKEERIEITTVFNHGEKIPEKYTCDGADVSPPLKIQNVPAQAKTIAIIVEDPDAPLGTFTHWIIWNIPAQEKVYIPQGVPQEGRVTDPIEAVQGINDFRKIGYNGPCPPPGKTHRYYIRVYALDTELNLKPGANRAELEKAIKGHVLAEGSLYGTYQH